MKLWMAVDATKYELPIAVAESAEKLGKMLGLSKRTIYNKIEREENGTKPVGYRIVRVEERG